MKLNEIEARVMAPAGWADDRRQQDCELLIRAVRQLGAVYKTEGVVSLPLPGVDPDVLELIKYEQLPPSLPDPPKPSVAIRGRRD